MRRALPLALFALSACQLSRYQDSTPLPKPAAAVLPAVQETLERRGFRVTSVSADGKAVEAVQVRLSPVFGGGDDGGIRWTASVKIDEPPEGTVVRIMVQREVNGNILNPLDEKGANWGHGDFDEAMEELLLYEIQEKVSPTRLPPKALRQKRR